MQFIIGNQIFDGDVRLAIQTALAQVGEGETLAVTELSGVVVGHATAAGWQWTQCGKIAWGAEVDGAKN